MGSVTAVSNEKETGNTRGAAQQGVEDGGGGWGRGETERVEQQGARNN